MHITAEMILAVERGEMSEDELFDMRIEHLAALCPGCAEVLAAHQERLAHGEDPASSRRLLEAEFLAHALLSRGSRCERDHDDNAPS